MSSVYLARRNALDLCAKLLGGSAAAGAARIVQIGSTLALVPILVQYLGPDQFAIWIAASSIMNIGVLLDFGIGSHLVNQIAGGKSSLKEIQNSLSTGIAMVGAIGLFGGVLLSAFCLWSGNFPGRDTDKASVLLLSIATICLFAPLGLIPKIRLGLGEQSIHSGWDVLSSATTFLAILFCVVRHADLRIIVLQFCAIPIAVLLLNAWHMCWRRPLLVPTRDAIEPSLIRHICLASLPFCILNAAAIFSFSLDGVVALYNLEPAQAAEFGVGQRIALGLQTLSTMMLAPFWPRFRAAVAAQDMRAAKRVLATGLLLAIGISMPFSIAVFFLGGQLSAVWTKGAITLSHSLSMSLAVWIPVLAVSAMLNACMNVPQLVWLQMRFACIACIVALAIKFSFCRYLGAEGVIWTNIICFSLILIAPSCLALTKLVRSLQAEGVQGVGVFSESARGA